MPWFVFVEQTRRCIKHFGFIGFQKWAHWPNWDKIGVDDRSWKLHHIFFITIANCYLSVVWVMHTTWNPSDFTGGEKKIPLFLLDVFHVFKESCNRMVSQLTSYMSRLLLRFHDDLWQKKKKVHPLLQLTSSLSCSHWENRFSMKVAQI